MWKPRREAPKADLEKAQTRISSLSSDLEAARKESLEKLKSLEAKNKSLQDAMTEDKTSAEASATAAQDEVKVLKRKVLDVEEKLEAKQRELELLEAQTKKTGAMGKVEQRKALNKIKEGSRGKAQSGEERSS